MTGTAKPLGPFLERWEWPTGEVQLLFHCPACESTHAYWLAHPEGRKGPIWEFDGDMEHPSFTPSLRIRGRNAEGDTCCHLFVRAGQIEYCSDCTHTMAGKTVPMEQFP